MPPICLPPPARLKMTSASKITQIRWEKGPMGEMTCKMQEKAGGGNRTRVTSLEGWSFTPKLHPHKRFVAWPKPAAYNRATILRQGLYAVKGKMSNKTSISMPKTTRKAKGFLEIKGCSENNLKNINVKIGFVVIVFIKGTSNKIVVLAF